jgi:hypothetical protein
MNWMILAIVFIIITALLVAGILLTWFLYVEPNVKHYVPLNKATLDDKNNEQYNKLSAEEVIKNEEYKHKRDLIYRLKQNEDGTYAMSNEKEISPIENNPYYNFSRGKIIVNFKTEEHHIESPFQEFGSMFGFSSCLNENNYLLVGAKNHGLNCEGAAVLLKYDKNTKKYIVDKILIAPNYQQDAFYGYKVMIKDSYLLVSAPYEKNGFIYIYSYEENKFPILIASVTSSKTKKFGVDFIIENLVPNKIMDLVVLGLDNERATYLKKSIELSKTQDYYDNFDIEEMNDFI